MSTSDQLVQKAQLLSMQARSLYETGLMWDQKYQQSQQNINSALNSIDTSSILRNHFERSIFENAIFSASVQAINAQYTAEMNISMNIDKQKREMMEKYEKYLAKEFSKFTAQEMNEYIKITPICQYHQFFCEVYHQDSPNLYCRQINLKECPYNVYSWYRNETMRQIDPNPSHEYGFATYHNIRGIYNALDNKDVAKGKQLIKAKEEEFFA
jgi:hypothetical protein